jgi:hypothetical protein
LRTGRATRFALLGLRLSATMQATISPGRCSFAGARLLRGGSRGTPCIA